MKSVPLTAYPRTAARRSGVKKLRESGRVPAVIYGRLGTPQNLELKLKEIETLIHHSVSETLLVDLAVSKDATRPQRLALLQEIQHHPISGQVLHVDFHEVAANEKVTILVPLEAVGEPAGVKSGGGTLEHVLFRLKVRALPKDLPEIVQVDVSALEIGKSIHLGDIPIPHGVEILGDKKLPVFAVAAPITEAEEAAAAEGTPAGEVEMTKEKKEPGAEGGAAPAKAGDKAAGDKAADKKPADKKK